MDEMSMDGGMGGDPRLDAKMKLLEELMQWAQKGQAEELKTAYRQGPGADPIERIDAEGAVVEKGALDAEGKPELDAEALLSALDDEDVRKLLGEG